MLVATAGLVAAIGLSSAVLRSPGARPAPVEVRAEGSRDPNAAPTGPVDGGAPSSTVPSSTSSPSASSTTATTTAAHPTSTTNLRPTTTTAPTTTTTGFACARTEPQFAFAVLLLSESVGWAAGGHPALQRSSDGGRTWTPACLQADAVTGSGSFFGVAFATDGRHGWATGGTSQRPLALRTIDGGEHWLASTLPTDLTGNLGGVSFPDTSHGWTVGSRLGTGPANAAGGYVLATADGGRTWATQPVPPDVARLNRVVFPDTRHGWAVGASDGRPALIATADGGATWAHQTLPPRVRTLRDVAFRDAQQGWAVGNLDGEPGQDPKGVVLATSDGGRTWTHQATTARDLWTLAVVDGDTVFAGGGYGLWSTRDDGATWSEQRFALPALDAITFVDATRGWVTHSMFSAVCRTDDGGRTWTASDIRPGRTPAVACTP